MTNKVFIGGSRKVSRLNNELRNIIDHEIIEKHYVFSIFDPEIIENKT